MFHDAGCAQCHRRSKVGGGAGPDLTNLSQRRKLREVVESIVTPSNVIAPEFATVQILTGDGKIVAGRIEREDKHAVVIRSSISFQGPIEIPVEEIEQRVVSQLSTMPASLLDTWELPQILELIAYLMEQSGSTEAPRN